MRPSLSGARIIRLSTLMPSTTPTSASRPAGARGLAVGRRRLARAPRRGRTDARRPRADRCTSPRMPRSCSCRSTVDSNASIVSGSSPRGPAGVAQLGVDEGGDIPPERGEVGRVLDLEHDADLAALLERRRAHEVEHVAQAQHRLLVVERRARRPQLRQSLAAAQRRQLVPREVLGEPAGQLGAVDRLRRAAVGELEAVGDIRRARDLVLVPHDEHAVPRDDDVGLDRVDAHREREVVRRAGVLRPIAGRAAVSDDERAGPGHRFRLPAARAPTPGVPPARSKPSHSADLPRSRRVRISLIHSTVLSNPFTLECESSGPQQPRIQQPGVPGPARREDLPRRPAGSEPRRPDPVRGRRSTPARMPPPTRSSRACTPPPPPAPSRPTG